MPETFPHPATLKVQNATYSATARLADRRRETVSYEALPDYQQLRQWAHDVKKQIGLDSLHDALAGRTSVLSGPSGVGKSSLLNGMYPGLNLRVGEISESVNKGRHTTVGALLHPLPDAGYVVDTPGLREVGMARPFAAVASDRAASNASCASCAMRAR